MPLSSDPQLVMLDALVKVPDADTPFSQSVVQPDAEILIAKQVTAFKLVQPSNMEP